MTSPPEPDQDLLAVGLSPIAHLVAEGMERLEREGQAGLDALCEAHPDHAAELRRRFAALREIGLLDGVRAFGPYRIVRTLGQGGMGVVHLAHDERLQRDVALKALPSRLALSPRALKRFRREIRAVAQLRHPSIVPIHDVGEQDGVPYFTMEYVEGRTLADALAAIADSGLPPDLLTADHLGGAGMRSYVEAAVRIALDVADALQHAHERGVVHRDVKPGNILLDGTGRARLFDFGLARLDSERALTQSGDFAGTPFYGSPEQVSPRTEGIDHRTDVYSLGVTLYEMLALRRPFAGKTTEDVVRQIAGREPPPLRRGNPLVPRDLETICLAAMEKDPALRYQTAGELADDLRRFLEFRPVKARPVGPAVRLLRFVRRNPALSSALALAVVIAVGVPVGLGLANVAIRAEKDRALQASRAADEQKDRALASQRVADAQRQKAESVISFLLASLEATDPARPQSDVSVADILRRMAGGVGEQLAGQARLAASVREALGNSFTNLGLYDEAEEQFRAAQALCEDDPDGRLQDSLGVSLNNLSVVLARSGRLEEAERVAQQGLDLNRQVHGEPSTNTADSLNNLAIVRAMRGDKAGTAQAFAQVLEQRRTLGGEKDLRVAEAMINLAIVTADAVQSEALLRGALALQEELLPPGDVGLAPALSSLAMLRFREPDAAAHDEAVELQRRALEVRRSRLGDDHPEVAAEDVVLAIMLLDGRSPQVAAPEAETLLREAVATYRRVHPDGHPRMVTALQRLAQALRLLGRPDEAGPLDQEAAAMEASAQGRTPEGDAGAAAAGAAAEPATDH